MFFHSNSPKRDVVCALGHVMLKQKRPFTQLFPQNCHCTIVQNILNEVLGFRLRYIRSSDCCTTTTGSLFVSAQFCLHSKVECLHQMDDTCIKVKTGKEKGDNRARIGGSILIVIEKLLGISSGSAQVINTLRQF